MEIHYDSVFVKIFYQRAAAFRSTLEETRQADCLLHIIDAHNENKADQVAQVNDVLQEIGANEVRQIEIYNKIDLLNGYEPRIDRDKNGQIYRVWLSATSGKGVDLLMEALEEEFCPPQVREWLRVPASNGRLRAKLFSVGKVLRECVEENGDLLLQVEVSPRDLENLQKTEGIRVSPDNINCCS